MAITIIRPRDNGVVTYARQFTFNPQGFSNREVDGAVVSGMPVSGVPISSLPIGSKIALTDPSKLSPNEVGYIIVQEESDRVLSIPDAHQKSGLWKDRVTVAQQFIADMTAKAQAVCTVAAGAMTKDNVGGKDNSSPGNLSYFADATSWGANPKRAFWNDYWLEDRATHVSGPDSPYYFKVAANGEASSLQTGGSTSTLAVRPLIALPNTALVAAEPNAAGAYELA